MAEFSFGVAESTELEEARDLIAAAFPAIDHQEPVLGISDDVVIASDLESFLHKQNVRVFTLKQESNMVGANVVIPQIMMDPARTGVVDRRTAYIYYTAIQPERQGQGLVKHLSDYTFKGLLKRGFVRVEQHCMADGVDSYGLKVERSLAPAIEQKIGPQDFFGLGPEIFFRIDLFKAVELATRRAPETQAN